jgi:hypothetical protein
MVRKAMVGLAVAGALFVAAGCGGDDSTLSREEFDVQLELVCNEGMKDREELVRAITREFEEKREQKPTTQYQVENLRKLIASYKETTDEIAELDLPEQGGKEAEEMLQAREDATAKVEASPLGTRDSLETVFKKANNLAEELEAKSCAF